MWSHSFFVVRFLSHCPVFFGYYLISIHSCLIQLKTWSTISQYELGHLILSSLKFQYALEPNNCCWFSMLFSHSGTDLCCKLNTSSWYKIVGNYGVCPVKRNQPKSLNIYPTGDILPFLCAIILEEKTWWINCDSFKTARSGWSGLYLFVYDCKNA